MGIKTQLVSLVVLLLISLEPIVSANTTIDDSGLSNVTIIIEPYMATIVITPQGNMSEIMNDCKAYVDVVRKKVFGNHNPAVNDTMGTCVVGNNGKVYYAYILNKNSYIEKNGTLIINPIPLTGKFSIKIVPYNRIDIENGTRKFYVYMGKDIEFINSHIPVGVYDVVNIPDPQRTFYVLPMNPMGTMLIFSKDFDFSKIRVEGKTVNETINGFTYIRGKITKIEILDNLGVYFVYDRNCYNVSRDSDNDIHVQRLRENCKEVPTPAIARYNGRNIIYITYKPPSRFGLRFLTVVGVTVVMIGLVGYIKRRKTN